MKQLNIPFELGLQYENWEFDLEVKHDRIKGCDSYKYIGEKFLEFLNYPVDETELIFNFDILEVILITLNKSNIDCNFLLEMISTKLNYTQENFENYKSKWSKFIIKPCEIIVTQNSSNLYVLVTNPKFSIYVIDSLLC